MYRYIFLFILALAVSGCGGSSSRAANQPPAITDVADQVLEANTSSGVLSVTVSDDITAPAALLFAAVSDNDTLVPAAAINTAADGNIRTLTVTPTPSTLGSATITLTVRDADGLSAATSFLLTVNPQNVSFNQLLRDVFADDANAAPRDLNALQINGIENADDFTDLLP